MKEECEWTCGLLNWLSEIGEWLGLTMVLFSRVESLFFRSPSLSPRWMTCFHMDSANSNHAYHTWVWLAGPPWSRLKPKVPFLLPLSPPCRLGRVGYTMSCLGNSSWSAMAHWNLEKASCLQKHCGKDCWLWESHQMLHHFLWFL